MQDVNWINLGSPPGSRDALDRSNSNPTASGTPKVDGDRGSQRWASGRPTKTADQCELHQLGKGLPAWSFLTLFMTKGRSLAGWNGWAGGYFRSSGRRSESGEFVGAVPKVV